MSVEERFWEKVAKAGLDECWLWCGAGGSYSYGYFWDGSKQTGAHRFALALKLGRELVFGECALHSCDNPRCVNPAHLFLGTNADNSRDMASKGRQTSGHEKLTKEAVLVIRREYVPRKVTLKMLAERYGVLPETVWHVVHWKTWQHVREG